LGLLRARGGEPKPLGLIAVGSSQDCAVAAAAQSRRRAAGCGQLLDAAALLTRSSRRDWACAWLGLALGRLPLAGLARLASLQRGVRPLCVGGQGLSRLTSLWRQQRRAASSPCWQVAGGRLPWLPLWPFGLAWPGGSGANGPVVESRWLEPGHRAGCVLPLQTQLPLGTACCSGTVLAWSAHRSSPRLSGRSQGFLRRLPWFWPLGLVLWPLRC